MINGGSSSSVRGLSHAAHIYRSRLTRGQVLEDVRNLPSSRSGGLAQDSSVGVAESSGSMAARAYQTEMYEESIRGNIIVVVRQHYRLANTPTDT